MTAVENARKHLADADETLSAFTANWQALPTAVVIENALRAIDRAEAHLRAALYEAERYIA